jgi:hypothetical protein
MVTLPANETSTLPWLSAPHHQRGTERQAGATSSGSATARLAALPDDIERLALDHGEAGRCLGV